MQRLRLFGLSVGLALVGAIGLAAQNPPYPIHVAGPITVVDTGTCTTLGSYVKANGRGNTSVGITVAGTWTGTLSFYAAVDGASWAALNVTPSNSTTAVTTTTGNGTWTVADPGGAWVCVDASATVTGQANVTINVTLGLSSMATSSGGGGGGSGTVTSVSVVGANGLAGTVATATTTPAITLSTSVTGLVKGNGTALVAATAGTDYVAPQTTFAGYGIVDTATNLATAISSQTTGTGNFARATSPTFVTPALGTPDVGDRDERDGPPRSPRG